MLRLTRVLRPAATALRRQRRPASFVRCFSEGADEAAPANPAAEGQENLYGGPDNWDPKVEAIVDQIGHLNLFEVAEFVECLRVKLNLQDVPMGVAMVGGGDAGAEEGGEAEEKEERHVFDVKLESFDDKAKIKIIKELRALTDLGLKEAKALVESAPCIIKKDVSKDDAAAMMEKLKALGGVCVLE
eukprot:INCI3403.1.p2 GENE.INCI3403.1~~INCI3403.1.p2  ORF type:complete len:187 (-),score=51.27 INCI3403.1:178-738(-)